MLSKLLPKSPIQTAFMVGGVLSTFASIDGTLSYLMIETGNEKLLSGVAAVGMGAIIYGGWEVAFNHRGWGKRLAALIIAGSFAVLSSWTIYQNIIHPTITAEQTKQDQTEQRKVAEQDRTRLQLEQQQADIRASIAGLREQNTSSLAEIDRTNTTGGKTATWQAAQIHKGIDGRNTQITTLTQQGNDLAKRQAELDAPPAQAGNGKDAPTATNDGGISWPMLARAALYEVLTALFLLFGSWFRQAEEHKAASQVAVLVTTQAEHDKAYDRLLAAIHNANIAATAHASAINDAGAEAAAQAKAASTAAADAAAQAQAAAAATGASQAVIDKASHAAHQLQVAVDAANGITTDIEVATQAAHTATQAAAAATGAANGLDEKLQATIIQCNKVIAHVDNAVASVAESVLGATGIAPKSVLGQTNSVLGATESVLGQTETKTDNIHFKLQAISNEDVLLLIKNYRIEVDNKGLVTSEAIMSATGWGMPKSRKALVDAFNTGYLTRKAHGHGYVYQYKTVNGAETAETNGALALKSPQNPAQNVVSISQARSH